MESIIVACITGVVTLVGVILSNSKSRAVMEVKLDKLVARHLFLQLFSFFAVDRFLRLFDERNDIAHTEDAACDAVGVKDFEVFGFFARTDKQNGFTGHRFKRKRRTASRIGIEFC